MKKKVFNYMLLAVMMLGLGITFTSCDDKLTEEEKQQKQEQEDDAQFLLTSEFWQVVGQLSTAEVLPDDWQTQTFEPGIGEASDKSTTTRIVPTNEAEAAAESFENLTGVELNGLTAYEWKRDFGSLTYKQLNDGTAWAEVEVDIKQMPGLKRIVYCTPEQQGLNASVPGTPYYRFGDVIKKPNAQGVMEYWVCVRPCFGPEKKGDMHWMCLGSLPESHIETYTYTKQNRQWWWYKSLTTNDEHIKNLSEMTFAIMNPTEWADYYDVNPYKCMFHDFSHENISYHNRYFWQMVQKAWNTKLDKEGGKTVFELLFHRTMDQMKADGQLHFFYGSADGLGWSTWYMKMQTVSVDHHINNKTYNFRELIKQNHKKSCENLEFDIHEYSDAGHPTLSTYFQSELYIYPLRYATGKQLFGTQPGYYQSMDGSNGIQDVYVFNTFYEKNVGNGAELPVFTADDTEERSWSYFQPGTVMEDTETGHKWICYLGWYDDGTNNIGDHKVRFISFDDFGEKVETYSVNNEDREGKFNHRLIPEEEAPMAMAAFYELALSVKEGSDYAFRKACMDYSKVNTAHFILEYDTVTVGKSHPIDHLYSFSLAYEPKEGRKSGTQPYLRMVADNSNNSFRSEGGDEYSKYLHYYFYKHYNEDGRRNVLLDLTHLFDAGAWIGDKPIKADRWSRCVTTITKKRNGDFTKEECGKGRYSSYNYAYRDCQWVFNKKDSLAKYTDAYFAPVLMASYMEIDDSKRLNHFTGNYNGKKFRLLSYPNNNQIMGTMVLPFSLSSSFNTLSYMDEEPFNPIK